MRDTHRLFGTSAEAFLLEHRLARAQALLEAGVPATAASADGGSEREPRDQVSVVAAAVGLNAAYFADAYLRWRGHPPSRDLPEA